MKRMMEGIRKVVTMVVLFTAVIILSGYIARTAVGVGLAHIRGDSMDPSLKEGQVYMYTERSPVERYDVVLSDFADDGGSKVLVKRVIGIPGDDLAVIHGKLYINKMYLEEPYVVHEHPEFDTESFRRSLGPEEYFLMGDNRDESMDSRNELGIVHKDNIIGVLKRDVTKLKKGVENNE